MAVAVSRSRTRTAWCTRSALSVDASSVYEAVALAVEEFRSDTLSEPPSTLTEFTISILRPSVEHRIRLGQVTKWTEGTRDGQQDSRKDKGLRSYWESAADIATLAFALVVATMETELISHRGHHE